MPDGTYLVSQPPPHGDPRFNDAQVIEWDADPNADANELPQTPQTLRPAPQQRSQ